MYSSKIWDGEGQTVFLQKMPKWKVHRSSHQNNTITWLLFIVNPSILHIPISLEAFALSFPRVILSVSQMTVLLISKVTKFAQQLCISSLQGRPEWHTAPMFDSKMNFHVISAQHSTFWCLQHSVNPNNHHHKPFFQGTHQILSF